MSEVLKSFQVPELISVFSLGLFYHFSIDPALDSR
jgi:hypothetical protein